MWEIGEGSSETLRSTVRSQTAGDPPRISGSFVGVGFVGVLGPELAVVRANLAAGKDRDHDASVVAAPAAVLFR